MKCCCFGELLIDVTPYGISDKGYEVFEFNPGGAPANVACALSLLNQQSSFIGQVGDDHFGRFLHSVLLEKNVDAEGLLFSTSYLTTLAIVSLQSDGERSFSFYRKDGADVMISVSDTFLKKIDESDLFHFGSVSMTHALSRESTLELIQYAKQQGKKISFDVNLRERLWENLDEALDEIIKVLPHVDVLKVSEEELLFLTSIEDGEVAANALATQYSIPLILITYGAAGSAVYYKNRLETVAPYTVNAVDATGAGDAFYGAFLSRLMNQGLDFGELTHAMLIDFLRFSNAAGAIATTKKGAIGSLPTKDQIDQMMGVQL